MPIKSTISFHRRSYNKLVASETMEDFALRYTAVRARKWSHSRIANTALGIVAFMVLEAIGGAITLSYGFTNAAWAILALMVIVFISGAPISYYSARYGVDIDLLTRGAGFGYIGSSIASLIYASFTFIFFALEAAIMSMALTLLLDIPLWIGYAVSALIVIPLVTHGIAYISRFQVITQPLWMVLQLIPLLYVFNHPDSSFSDWIAFSGDAGTTGDKFNIVLFGAASALVMSLVAQIGEQADFLRFLPPKTTGESSAKWYAAMLLAGPGWIIWGAAKLFLGSFLAYFALQQGVDRSLAADPANMYHVAFGYIFNNGTASILIAALFVIISQLKINVANAYAGSLAWSNFFCRLTHNHPGRVVWTIFNVLIALLLMELGIYKTIESTLQIYSVLVLAWIGSVTADLLINKPLGISPPGIEFKRAKLFDINPVGTCSMVIASVSAFVAQAGYLGLVVEALNIYLAFFIPFIMVPVIGWMTGGKYYLVKNNTEIEGAPAGELHKCTVCENSFDTPDMSFCPAYGAPICSLCCSLEVQCGDQCRKSGTLPNQLTRLGQSVLSERTLKAWPKPFTQWLLLVLCLSSISGLVLLLIFWQLTDTSPELSETLATTLLHVFCYLLILISVVSWLFTLAKQSQKAVLVELRVQRQALAKEVQAHKNTMHAYQQAKNQAESANKAKSRYLAGLSHELRTPLNVLLGYAQLLSANEELPTAVRTPLLTMKRNGEHLGDLIEGLLEVSKIEAGRLSLNKENIQLGDLLDQLIETFKPQAVAKGLIFNYHFALNLPREVSGDKQRLRQILINLLSNAIKFTETGSVSFIVRYRNEVAHFIVEDTGPGISKGDQKIVFHPFERSPNINASVGGTGLGLTISKALAELMGGDVQLTSKFGEGSLFHVRLMLPRLSSVTPFQQTQSDKICGYSGDRKTILAVDDDSSQRQLMADILTPLGFTVYTASSAAHGMVVLQRQTVDLLLLDIRMPDIDGWQATRLIREAGFTLPIIIVSANVRDLDKANTVNVQHNDYVVKPFDISDLLKKIEVNLGITWMTHKRHTDNETEPATTKPAAGAYQFQSLRSMAEIGYLTGFNNKLDTIEQDFTMPGDSAATLRSLAAQCQFKQITEKIDQLTNT